MSRRFASIALLVATSLAQTYTDCNPNNSTCPDNPALGTTFAETYNKTQQEFDPRFWNVTAGPSLISFGDDGAALALSQKGDSVTVKSNFYIFWGQVEVIFKAATGTGIISTAITLSDNLDEIDWEIKGGNLTSSSNNFYGWGDTSQFNSEYPAMNPGPQADFHNYTVDWTQERILYYLDGNVVRTVPYAEPGHYPQTPSRIQFGAWCGGCSESQGTIDWAGGKADWDAGPFVMTVQSIRITDGTTNSSTYSYGDHSGSYQSIKVVDGESAAYKEMHKLSTTEKVTKHWDGLSTGGKIGIAAGVLGAVFIFLVAFTFYCLRQRKAGRTEAALHDQEWEKENTELMAYRTMMSKGNFAMNRESVMLEVVQAPKQQSRYSRLSGRF